MFYSVLGLITYITVRIFPHNNKPLHNNNTYTLSSMYILPEYNHVLLQNTFMLLIKSVPINLLPKPVTYDCTEQKADIINEFSYIRIFI